LFKKTYLFSILLLLVSLHEAPLFADENPFMTRFPLKEGVIHYAIRGNTNGTRLLYFKEFGAKQLIVEEKSADILQHRAQKKSVTLILPDAKYILDLQKHTAIKEENLPTVLYRKFQKLTPKQQHEVLKNLKLLKGRSLENQDGICILHAKKVLDFWCNEEQIEGETKCSIANGALVLESSIDILGYNTKMFATKIEAKELDPSLFELPKEFHITNASGKTNTTQIMKHLLSANETLSCQPQNSRNHSGEELHKLMFEEIQNLSKHF